MLTVRFLGFQPGIIFIQTRATPVAKHIHSPTWPILLLVSTADMCLLSLPRVIIKF